MYLHKNASATNQRRDECKFHIYFDKLIIKYAGVSGGGGMRWAVVGGRAQVSQCHCLCVSVVYLCECMRVLCSHHKSHVVVTTFVVVVGGIEANDHQQRNSAKGIVFFFNNFYPRVYCWLSSFRCCWFNNICGQITIINYHKLPHRRRGIIICRWGYSHIFCASLLFWFLEKFNIIRQLNYL